MSRVAKSPIELPKGVEVKTDGHTLIVKGAKGALSLLLHPQIDVRWLDMGSQEVYDRIRSEAANPQADIWFGGPDTIFAR